MRHSSENPFSLTAEKQKLFSALLQKRGITAPTKQTIPKRNAAEPLPLSFAQQRLWFIHQLDPDSPAYNSFTPVYLKGRLNMAVLQQGLNEMMRRHEVLRTTFSMSEGQPVQVITPLQSLALPLVDLREFPRSVRKTRALQLAHQEVRRPFDLNRGPLIRSLLLRLDQEEYLAVLMIHHIISDEWSMDILIRELALLYQAFVNQQPSPLAELTIQYADFSAWEQTWLQGPVLEKQLSYWKKKLAGTPPVITLPLDRPRPPFQTFHGASQSFALSSHLSAALIALSHSQDVTMYMLLLSAFQTLLHRHSGQTDIVVSMGLGNRRWRETEALIGCFINMLLLRAELGGNPSFRDLLKQVRRVVLEAYEHQDLPFDKLVEALQPKRSPSYHPLTQVMFVLHNTPASTIHLPGLQLDTVSLGAIASQFDLLLRMGEAEGILAGDMEYNTDLFDAETIQRLLQHFQVLLESITSDPDKRLAELPILTAAERRQLLVEWNRTRENFPQDQCLHRLFEAQVRRSPHATAVMQDSGLMTYATLNRCANQLAHHLLALNVQPDSRIGLCVERSFNWVIGLMGILKAGGAYVPLDPNYPEERLAFMLEDAKVQILLTQSSLASSFIPHPVSREVICLDRDAPVWTSFPETDPESLANPSNLAYVIYTSGSTGRPKGVMLDHRGRVNNFSDFNRRFQVNARDRLIALSSLSFDMCAYDVFGILAAGAAVVLPTLQQARDPAAWAELMITHRVTIWHSVPALLEMFVEQVAGQPSLYPSFLRLVLLGGDWIPVSLPNRLKTLSANIQVVSLGGATEASMDSTIYAIETTNPDWKSIPYGKPMANQRAYVLDSHLQPAPVGIPGELHLGGAGLAWGYLGHPELTAEKFIPDPFDPQGGGRLYKTGDLVCYLPDGNLNLLGRMDHQIKIRGFRIELGEIAAILRRHPAVRESLVAAGKDRFGEPILAAYVIPEQEPPPTAAELRGFLQINLPEYMLPASFIFLKAWPLTPNGKIDRRSLPAPFQLNPEMEKSYTAPRTALEKTLAGIWAQVLGLEKVGINDNFFELGGSSLHGMRVLSNAKQAGFRFTPKDILQYQTIAELATVAEAIPQASGEPANARPAILTDVEYQKIKQCISLAEVESVYPLAPFQEHLLYHYLSKPEPGLLLVQSSFRQTLLIPNPAIVQEAWQRLVERHAILRTSFLWDGLQRPLQVVHKQATAQLKFEDWRDLSAAQCKGRLTAYLEADRARGAEPQRPEAVRLFFGQESEQTYQMIVSFSYLCLDGWSLNILFNEFSTLYEALVQGHDPHPEPGPPYQDYIAWLQHQDLSEAKTFWQEQFRDYQTPASLIKRVPGNSPGREKGFHRQCAYLPEATTNKLRAWLQEQHLTPNSLIQAIWALLISRYTGAKDVAFGVAMFNRPATLPGGETIVGSTLNVLPLRARISTEASLLPWLKELMRRQMELNQYAYTPLKKLYEWCEIDEEQPLFESYMVFQNLGRTFAAYPDKNSIFIVNTGYPLRLDISPFLELEVSMSYQRQSFDDATIGRMLRHFITGLEAMAADPAQHLGDLLQGLK